MITKSNKIKILILMFMIISLTGCWDYHEMVDFSDITCVAIDKGEKKRYKTTVEGKKFTPKIDIDVKPVLYESEGDTIFEALLSTISSSGRKLYIGSLQTIIISEEIANEGISEVLNFFSRSNKARFLIGVYVARGTDAASLIKDTALYSVFAGYEIAEAGDQIFQFLGYENEHHLYQVMDKLYDDYKYPVLTVLELIDSPKDKKTFKIEGLAAFRDEKLAGYLPSNLIPSYGLWINHYKNGMLSIPYEDKGYIGIEIYESSSRRKFTYIDGKVHLYNNVKLEIGYSDNGTTLYGIDIIKEKDVIRVTEQFLQEQTTNLHKYVKEELKIDILEIEEFYRKYNYKHWKKIHDEYDFLNDTIVHFEFNIVIRGDGEIRVKK